MNNPSNPTVRGWEDVELSSEGKLQIQLLAEKLRPYKPQYIFSSDFMRDTQTAMILASRLGISGYEADFNARTWDVGQFSGKPESEVNPAIAALYQRTWETPPGSSESFDEFSRRWLGFLDRKMEFAQIDGYRPTIIVTHGRNIALADSHFNLKPAGDGLMPLAGEYATISIDNDQSIRCELQGESECVCQDV